MYEPPPTTTDRSPETQLTWRSILAAYAVAAAVPLALWIAANPLAGVVALAAIASLAVGVLRAVRAGHCLATCRKLTFDLVGGVRVTIARPHTNDAC